MECAALHGGERGVAWLLMEEREERKNEIYKRIMNLFGSLRSQASVFRKVNDIVHFTELHCVRVWRVFQRGKSSGEAGSGECCVAVDGRQGEKA